MTKKRGKNPKKGRKIISKAKTKTRRNTPHHCDWCISCITHYSCLIWTHSSNPSAVYPRHPGRQTSVQKREFQLASMVDLPLHTIIPMLTKLFKKSSSTSESSSFSSKKKAKPSPAATTERPSDAKARTRSPTAGSQGSLHFVRCASIGKDDQRHVPSPTKPRQWTVAPTNPAKQDGWNSPPRRGNSLKSTRGDTENTLGFMSRAFSEMEYTDADLDKIVGNVDGLVLKRRSSSGIIVRVPCDERLVNKLGWDDVAKRSSDRSLNSQRVRASSEDSLIDAPSPLTPVSRNAVGVS